MIRAIFVALFLCIYFILSLPILLVCWIIKFFNKNLGSRITLLFAKIGFVLALKICGTNIIYKGLENIPKDSPLLYVGNHSGFFDIVVTLPKFANATGFIAKKSIAKVPFLHLWIPLMGGLFIDRDDPRKGLATILTASEKIKSGQSIFLFPEGTRSKDGDFHEFKAGGFKIATKSNCTVMPVAITNTAEIFENHAPRITKTTVVVNYGKPIDTAQMDRAQKKELSNIAHSAVAKMLEENKKIISTCK